MNDPVTDADKLTPTFSISWITRGSYHPHAVLQQLVKDDSGIRSWQDIPQVGGFFPGDMLD